MINQSSIHKLKLVVRLLLLLLLLLRILLELLELVLVAWLAHHTSHAVILTVVLWLRELGVVLPSIHAIHLLVVYTCWTSCSHAVHAHTHVGLELLLLLLGSCIEVGIDIWNEALRLLLLMLLGLGEGGGLALAPHALVHGWVRCSEGVVPDAL